jgi:nitrogen fixation protein FixH
MSKAALWPVLVVALLAAGVGANLAFMVIAAGDPSFAVERDYYRRAVEWDRTLEQRRANDALGWRLSCRLDPAAGPAPAGELAVRLEDRAGTPLSGARVTLEAFHYARASQVVEGVLAPEAPGTYVARLPIARPGLWEMRFRAERGAEVFTHVLRVDVAGLPR